MQLSYLLKSLVVASILLVPTTDAQADLPMRGVLPPGFCGFAACTEGLHQYTLQEFAPAARTWEQASKDLPGGEAAWHARVNLLLLSADAWEKANEHMRAAMTYLKASRLTDRLGSYAKFKAAENLAQTRDAPLDLLAKLVESGALEQGYPRSALVAARIDARVSDGLPSKELARAALSGGARAQTCRWLSGRLVDKAGADKAPKKAQAALADLVYGRCLPDDTAKGFGKLNFDPSHQMRLERAERWYGAVRFGKAFAELTNTKFDKLDAVARCRANFRLGRTFYRLKRRTDAIKTYKKVIEACKDPKNEDERVRALYATGKMLFWRDKYDASQELFSAIVDAYGHRSHADDALLYLARIARKQGDAAEEKKLVRKALANYPGGDMVHEIVWEHLEDTYRSGKHAEFIEKLDALEMPAFDNQYFSQGRLLYFTGRAHQEQGEDAKAAAVFQKAWETYPFSFYGYIARQRLVEENVAPSPIAAGHRARVADWFFEKSWKGTPASRLVQIGLYHLATDVERARLAKAETTETDRWRLAYLEHMAGRFPVSHNIVRRQIEGRPWGAREDGRLVRWGIAWPNPFEKDILRAIVAEKRQARDDESVDPALPSAIMREESSFIEDVESWAGALGLMQLMPATAKGHDDDIEGVATPAKLKTSGVNIRVGVDHLYYLARRFDSHPVLMTAAYNAGGGAVSGWVRRKKTDDIALWVEDVPYDQTRNYTKRVIGSYAAYQWLSGIHDLDPSVLAPPK